MKKLLAGIIVLAIALGAVAFSVASTQTALVGAQTDTPDAMDNENDTIIDNEDDNVLGEENVQDEMTDDDTETPEGAPRTGHGTL